MVRGFTLFLSGILGPNLANFSPKHFGHVLLLKSIPLAQPQISNKIMCPYYPYVVLYF